MTSRYNFFFGILIISIGICIYCVYNLFFNRIHITYANNISYFYFYFYKRVIIFVVDIFVFVLSL